MKMYLRQEEKDRIMEQNENNKVQVSLSPYHTGGIQDGYDLDRILFDLDSQIELYTAHPDRADLLVAIGSGILCGAGYLVGRRFFIAPRQGTGAEGH